MENNHLPNQGDRHPTEAVAVPHPGVGFVFFSRRSGFATG